MVFIPDRTPDDDVPDDAEQWRVGKLGGEESWAVRLHVGDEPPEPDCREVELLVGEEFEVMW
jgi:hypothetical protein